MMTKLECSYPEYGYVMAKHYSDQMTGYPPNLMSLQCWVSTLGPNVRVVEPFVRHSRLGVNIYAASNASALETENNSVRLRDVLDLDMGETDNREKKFCSSRIIIADTPRKLILVDRECADDDQECMDCDTDAAKSSEIFAREFNFHIIHRCVEIVNGC